MFPFFGILLAAVLLFRLRAKPTIPPKAKMFTQVQEVQAIPRPMMLEPSQDTIEGLNQPQAPAPSPGFTPKTTGFQTPPIVAWDNPFLTF